MHESITVAKVRKATTVKIPAGGWVLISTPDEPFKTHIDRRTALVKDGFVNEDFSTLLIGRLSDSHPVARFVTAAEAKTAEETRKANETALANQNATAIELRKKADAAAAEKAAAEHKAKIAAINQENDATRNRDANSVPKPVVQLETTEADK